MTLLGNYRLIAELGHGGMGQVFLALMEGPARFAKLAVIKRLREHLLEDREFVAMLLEEARITSRLSHPNVVQLIEVGTADEEHFLVMEYLEGESFSRVRRRANNRDAPLDPMGELAVIADALSGLHYAHELADYDGTPLDVVHRDFTPSNVFITTSGHVKVVDFGIARAAGRATETRQGIVKGKIRYMAPEQATGNPVDRRADLFAAGIMIWEAAAGRRFWDCGDDEIGIKLVTGRYERSPRAVNPDVHPAIDRLCVRVLDPDPNERIATAAEMRLVLEQVLGDGLPAARRGIGQRVAQLFAKERAQIRKCIDEAGSSSSASMPLPEISSRNPKIAPSLSPLVVNASAPLPNAAAPEDVAPTVRIASDPALQNARATPVSEDAIVVALPPPRSRVVRNVVAGTVATFILAAGVWSYVLLRAPTAAAGADRAKRTAVIAEVQELASTSPTVRASAPAAPAPSTTTTTTTTTATTAAAAHRETAHPRTQAHAPVSWKPPQRRPPPPPPPPAASATAGKRSLPHDDPWKTTP